MKNIRCIEISELSQLILTSNKRKVLNAETEIQKQECTITAIGLAV